MMTKRPRWWRGRDLREIRKARGWKGRQLARLLNMDPAHLCRIEGEHRQFPPRVQAHVRLLLAYFDLLAVSETLADQNEELTKMLTAQNAREKR